MTNPKKIRFVKLIIWTAGQLHVEKCHYIGVEEKRLNYNKVISLDSDCQRSGGNCSMKEENCTGIIALEATCVNPDQSCCMPRQEPGMYV